MKSHEKFLGMHHSEQKRILEQLGITEEQMRDAIHNDNLSRIKSAPLSAVSSMIRAFDGPLECFVEFLNQIIEARGPNIHIVVEQVVESDISLYLKEDKE